MMADRIPVVWNKIITSGNSTIPLPVSWNTVQFRMGMNICFGNRVAKKKNDKPMVVVQPDD
jgi:hypothetical protein